jgi:hypothetical protein
MSPKEKRRINSLTGFLQGQSKPKTLGDVLNQLPIDTMVEKPDHQWVGTALQFETPDGEWGEPIDLKGDKGDFAHMTDEEKAQIKGEKGDKGNDGKNGKDGKDGIDGKNGKDGKNGVDGVDGVSADPDAVIKKMKDLKGKDRLPLSSIDGSEFLMKLGSGKTSKYKLEELMHGGGINKVAHDATLTGDGTDTSPLSASGVAENYKIKVSAGDTTPDYLLNKLVAGSGITITDSGAGNETLTISAHSGHTIQDEGNPLTQRTNLNFVGAGVTATDGGAVLDSTIVTIPTYTNTDTLDTVLTRGNTSLQAITAGGIRSGSVGVDGQFSMYKHISAGVDWITSINPNAVQTANANFYLPAAQPAATYLLNMTSGGVIGYDTNTYLTSAALTGYLQNNVGIAGGTTLIGGTQASESLTLSSTSNATKGFIYLGSTPLFAFDMTNTRFGLGVSTPTVDFAFGNTAARTIKIEDTANTVVGRALTIAAGSTVTGGTADMAGGDLSLKSGLGKGTGASNVIFSVGRTSTTSSTLQTLTEGARLNGMGSFLIGTTTTLPGGAANTTRLHVHMESDYGFNIFSTSGTSGATNFPTNIFFATRGTTASPTAIQSGDVLGSMNWTGGYGAAFPTWITGAYIRGIAAENFSLTGAGTDLVFTTVAKTTSTLSERMRITSQGELVIGRTTSSTTGSTQYAVEVEKTFAGTLNFNLKNLSTANGMYVQYRLDTPDYLVNWGLTGVNTTTSGPYVIGEAYNITTAPGFNFGSSKSDGIIKFYTGGTGERMRLTAAGCLIIEANLSYAFNNGYQAQTKFMTVSNDVYSYITYANFSDTYAFGCPIHNLERGRGTAASPTACLNGDRLGLISFKAQVGSGADAMNETAAIYSEVEEPTNTATQCGGNMIFRTTPNGTHSGTEKMRLTNAGQLKIAGTALRGTTEGTAHLDIFNGTAPAGTLTNGISIYAVGGLEYTMDAVGVRTAVSYGHTIFTPATTDTITLINNQNNLVNPAATIAALTMTFPASPVNNDTVTVKFTQIVTAITYTAGTGGATILSQVNGTVGGNYTWVYDSGNNTWY